MKTYNDELPLWLPSNMPVVEREEHGDMVVYHIACMANKKLYTFAYATMFTTRSVTVEPVTPETIPACKVAWNFLVEQLTGNSVLPVKALTVSFE